MHFLKNFQLKFVLFAILQFLVIIPIRRTTEINATATVVVAVNVAVKIAEPSTKSPVLQTTTPAIPIRVTNIKEYIFPSTIKHDEAYEANMRKIVASYGLENQHESQHNNLKERERRKVLGKSNLQPFIKIAKFILLW